MTFVGTEFVKKDGVLGKLERISISVGISYFASLSAKNAFSSSTPNGAMNGR